MMIMKLVFLVTSLVITFSIACSSYKSAGSPTVQNNNAVTAQVSPPNESVPTQDKPKCTLTLASVPVLNGLRLGMTAPEVLALFPGSKEDAAISSALAVPADALGTSSLVIRPAKYENKDNFTGISQITFMLLDGRVYNLIVNYNGPQHSHVDKFVAIFIEGTNLPPADQWEAYVGMDTQMKTLTCADFEVRMFAGGRGGNLNNVTIRDLEADKKLKARGEKASETPTP